MIKQLALNCALADDTTFENFYAGPNEKILRLLESLPKNGGGQFIYLWGPPRTGRSHLLMASCHSFSEHSMQTAYLPLKEQSIQPQMLENCEKMSLLCLDDLDAIVGRPIWEEAIFHCFNRLLATNGNLIVTTNTSPKALPCALPDLKSRLSSSIICQLKPSSDEQKLQTLLFRAERRGLRMSLEMANYLLNHYQRDLNTLFAMLEKMAKEALYAKRAFTIPFVKEVLGKHEKNG